MNEKISLALQCAPRKERLYIHTRRLVNVELKTEKISLDRELRRRRRWEREWVQWRWWWCCCWQDVRNNNKFIIMYMRRAYTRLSCCCCSSSEENFLLLVRLWVVWLRLSPRSQKTISDREFFLLHSKLFLFSDHHHHLLSTLFATPYLHDIHTHILNDASYTQH